MGEHFVRKHLKWKSKGEKWKKYGKRRKVTNDKIANYKIIIHFISQPTSPDSFALLKMSLTQGSQIKLFFVIFI